MKKKKEDAMKCRRRRKKKHNMFLNKANAEEEKLKCLRQMQCLEEEAFVCQQPSINN